MFLLVYDLIQLIRNSNEQNIRLLLMGKDVSLKKKKKSTKSSVGRNEVTVTAAAPEESKANIHVELYLHPYRYSIS